MMVVACIFSGLAGTLVCVSVLYAGRVRKEMRLAEQLGALSKQLEMCVSRLEAVERRQRTEPSGLTREAAPSTIQMSQRAKVVRMHRQGLDEAEIAREAQLPLQLVRMVLEVECWASYDRNSAAKSTTRKRKIAEQTAAGPDIEIDEPRGVNR